MTDLPDGWSNQDIGEVSIAGSASYDSDTGTFTVEASGEDIWDERDEFHYVYRSWSSDGAIVARVESLENTHEWAKAGVMIRESLSDDSKHAFMCLTPGNGASFQRRTSTGGSSASTSTKDGTAAPHWVKLVRRGDTLTGYMSGDGSGWTEVDALDISMSSHLYVGLALTSHDDSTVGTATMDQLGLSSPVWVTASGDTITGDGDGTLSLDARSVETLTVQRLKTDWTVTVEDAAGATVEDRVSEAGELELAWESAQDEVSPSITIGPPGDTYVGTYDVDVVAEGDGQSNTGSAALDIQLADATGLAESVRQYGITWEFDGTYTVGQYANGDWWVAGPVTITTIGPESTAVDGRVMHGTMLDPVGGTQGYDSYDSDMSYDPDLNVDPGASGEDLVVEEGSVVSSISLESPNEQGRPVLSDLAILTVVTAQPPADAFRPGPYSQDAAAQWTESDLDYGVLRSLQTVDSAPDLDAVTDNVDRFWNEQETSWTQRPVHAKNNQTYYDRPAVYGREIAYALGDGLLSLHLDDTDEQKRDLFVTMVQRGLDIYDRAAVGGVWEDNCGHNPGRKMTMLFAGLALDDTDILDMARADGPREEFRFQEDRQTFYVSDTDIENPDYTAAQNDEAAGETDGNGSVSGTLERTPIDPETFPPIRPGEIEFEVGEFYDDKDDVIRERITDDGNGTLTGSESATGTIDYEDGSWTIDNSIAGKTVRVDYEFSVTYKEEDRGMPGWGCQYTRDGGDANSLWNASYRWIGSAFVHHGLTAHLMDGAVEAWNYPPFVDYLDRYVRKGSPTDGPKNGIQPFSKDMWDAYRASTGSVAVIASGDTISSDEAAILSVDAESVETVTIRDLWIDWQVSVGYPAGATVDNRVVDTGELGLDWNTAQMVAGPTIAIDPPADTYIGGTYVVEVHAEGNGESATDIALLEIESDNA